MVQYKLIDVETSPVTLRMFPKTVKGHISYGHYQTLNPGTVYETDDPAQIDYLRNQKIKARYNPNLEQVLTDAGVPYEVIRCRSCGGRVKKIEYSQVEVIEE